MTYIAKAALFCDHCGESFVWNMDFGWDEADNPVLGWYKVDTRHHLCPDCAKVYNAKREEFEQQLKQYIYDDNRFTL